jgi:DNA-directed DNA polymerase III PolC
MSRVIVHLDADAFFASVEQASDPRLRGKPVAVGGEKRGIIASASYEARKFGIYTPMPTVRARRLCPKLIVLPGDFEKYEQFSRWMFSYAYDFTPEVEIGSIDEGYFDLSGARRSPLEIADTIRQAIRQGLKISVSEGLGSNKLVSQIASKLHKPAGFMQVRLGQESAFLHPLPNGWLPGIGPKTSSRLNAAGLVQIGQIAATPVDLLALLVGGAAPQLRNFANGIDDRPVVPAREPAKSYSQQETFAADTTDEEYVEAVLRRMADRLMAKAREEGKSIRTLTVKVRYNDMAEDQCGESLAEPTDLETEVYSRLRPLLGKAWQRRVSLRMVSLKFSNLYDGFFRAELPLESPSQCHEARRRLAEIIDELRKTRGPCVVMRGHDLLLEGGHSRPRSAEKPQEPNHGTRIQIENQKSKIKNCYVPLAVHSFYSFLDSTLSIDAIIALAKRYELPAIALTDQGNLHGAVDFIQAAKAAGIKAIVGAEIQWHGKPLRLYVENAAGYRNLCRILSQPSPGADGTSAGVPGTPGRPATVCGCNGGTEGLIATAPDPSPAALFPGRFYLEISSPEAGRRLPTAIPLPLVACRPIHYATAADRWKFDVVQSIRTRTLLRQAHPDKRLEGDFHFPSPAEMQEWFGQRGDLLAHSLELAERCAFELPLGKPQFPAFVPPDGSTPRVFLRQLVQQGLRQRYGNPQTATLKSQIEMELAIIHEVGYEEYFLVVWDLLQECRRRGIEWLTRGSAADSLVCYCLGISNVCPIRFDLYFRRFLNKERMQLNKLPDIDIDFPHDRKDDVIDLLFAKYGAAHMAVVGGFSTYQARSAIGDIAKVLGVSEYQIRRFTEHIPHARAGCVAEAIAERQECRDLPSEEEPYATALKMAEFLDGFPRHPKMHPCGVVFSRQPMMELSPCFISNKGYPTTHFDMDAVEAIGLVKMDVLAQGGLAVMRDVKAMLRQRGVEADLDNFTVNEQPLSGRNPNYPLPRADEPWTDPAVWEMIASGGARAVHHIESPAMIGLCRRCNVRDIDTLIAIVSVIRPGAANENKKTEFVRRYQGLSPVTYPHPSLEPCLRGTFGLVAYEEHILQICEAFAGLPAGRADVLRRALNKQKTEVIEQIGQEFIAAARACGHDEATIKRVWELVCGFQGYAFCKAHSTAYGMEAYQSAWLKRYFPVQFMAAVLSNGKGFYPPLVYVLECHRLGIPLLPPWVNEPGPGFGVSEADKGWNIRQLVQSPIASGLDRVLPGQKLGIRVPVTRVKGLTERTKERILRERARGAFESLSDFYRRVGPLSEEMESLIRVGALDGFGRSRTAQFWEFQFLRAANPGQGWLLPSPGAERLPEAPRREPTRRECLQWESELLDFPVSGHPLELYDEVAWETYCPVARLGEHRGETVVTCGLVIEQRIHHQVTGEPMKFLTLADWTGMVETELFAQTYKNYGLATVRYPVLEVTATVEPYENGRGYSLRVHRAGQPRSNSWFVGVRAGAIARKRKQAPVFPPPSPPRPLMVSARLNPTSIPQ